MGRGQAYHAVTMLAVTHQSVSKDYKKKKVNGPKPEGAEDVVQYKSISPFSDSSLPFWLTKMA